MINTKEIARQQENFKDLDLDFLAHPATSDLVKKTGVNAIKRSMRNLVFLAQGELGFNPYKGSGIHHQLFELFTPATVEALRKELFELFDRYEPRVNVFHIEIQEDLERNAINIDINFEIINYNEPYKLTVFLERVR